MASLAAALSPTSVASPDTVPASSAAPSTTTTPRCGPMASHGLPVASRMPGNKAVASVSRTQSAVEKQQGRGAKTLPAPLTETLLLQAMSELPDGTRRATETCYQCFQVCHLASYPLSSSLLLVSLSPLDVLKRHATSVSRFAFCIFVPLSSVSCRLFSDGGSGEG